ncbi:NAD(P)-binding domain-containing protein, partial [Streptomyces sp. SID685]|nr:NAD(P)-binding domain-containing protein [Streptomyces sp. SID685]
MTTITVLGNGRVGGNLATALARAGHEVRVADRT